jgi:hypothetical protein
MPPHGPIKAKSYFLKKTVLKGELLIWRTKNQVRLGTKVQSNSRIQFASNQSKLVPRVPQKCVLSLVCNYYLCMTRFWNFWQDLFEKKFHWFQTWTSFKNLARNDITLFYGMVLKGKIKTSSKLSTFPSWKQKLLLICDTWVGFAEQALPLSGALSM